MSIGMTISPKENEDFEAEQVSYVINGNECKKIFLGVISSIN